jgi:hypothetical protein
MSPIPLSGFEKIDFLSVSPQLLFTDRRDTKYIFHYLDWEDIMDALQENYYVVEHHGKVSQIYSTIYYDSSDLKYYIAHHNGHGNRVKMRTRTYEDGISFFEVKQKTNRGITIKERYSDIKDHVDGLMPQIEVVYDRITFYDKTFKEKLTFDFNLKFRDQNAEIGFSSIVIAESKKIKSTYSLFIDTIKRRKIESSSVSKYCLGIASLNKDIKQNNFKSLIHNINKLKNKYDVPSNY